MPKNPDIQQRKADHLTINLEKDVNSGLQNGLDEFHFIHNALPEIDLSKVDCSTTLFRHTLAIPLLVSSMTGGTARGMQINQQLAEAAQYYRISMGVGSQRVGIEHPESMNTFKVRKVAPDILLFANLGAIQLNYTYTIEHCKAAVDALEADALILHLNPLQEALMADGNTNFDGLLSKIEEVCRELSVPVVVKEVGWGISMETARRLINAGVQAIDVAGAGGTSWSEVEKYRSEDEVMREIAAAFKNWGIPTAHALNKIHTEMPDVLLIASGGIRDGVDAAKCLALGAKLVGMARPFLQAVFESEEELYQKIAVLTQQLRISMFACGARTISDLNLDKLQP